MARGLLLICDMRVVFAVLLAVAEVSAGTAFAAPATRVRANAAFHPTAFSVEVHGRGRPVILIPGLGCPGSVWRDTVQHLRGYQSHVLTLAGFAGKPRIDAPLVKTTVDELARYIRAHHLVHPVIIGHSLGGFVAYSLAAREPALVGPVVVVDAGAAGGTVDGDTASAASSFWRDASDAQFAQRIKDVFGQMSARPERLAPLLAEIAHSDRRAIGDAVYELSTTTVGDDLARIRAPVLLVLADGGLQSEYRRQARAIRERQIVVLPGTGHFVMLDDPRGFFAAVDDFLEDHSAVASAREESRSSGAAARQR